MPRSGCSPERLITLATTRPDASVYSIEHLAGLYAQRWQVELDILSRSIRFRKSCKQVVTESSNSKRV